MDGLRKLLYLCCSLLLASLAACLPSGFIAENVADTVAITGIWARNPRRNGKPMLLLASKEGEVKVLEDPDETPDFETILIIGEENMCSNGERGLQSIVVHPDFDENFFVYLLYTKYREGCSEGPLEGPWNVVERFIMDSINLEIDYDSREEIWRGANLHKEMHNGGAMAFGNDGLLYITTGDGGDETSAKPLNNVHGSIIRLNDDGSVPEDNPHTERNGYISYRCADTEGIVPSAASEDAVCAEVFANGFRNPFRLALDHNTKEKVRFAISDVGGAYWEELSIGGTDYAGKFYGWHDYEGVCKRNSAEDCPIAENVFENEQLIEPFHWYEHRSIKEGGCVAGAVFVPAGVWPRKYQFMFADFIFREIYNLEEDPDNECRACVPPRSGYLNETFYKSFQDSDEDVNSFRTTDIFFGPYEDTQALYVISRGGTASVTRIRYTGILNGPPIPEISLKDDKDLYALGEEIMFDASQSSDVDSDTLIFEWDFGDGHFSNKEEVKHAFTKPGEFRVRLSVTDTAGQAQETSTTIVVGIPPKAAIISPQEGEEFYVGQIFQPRGLAFEHNGDRIDDSQLSWEVRKHHADHFHPFLDPKHGNNLTLSPAPEPEDFHASTNSFLEIILTAKGLYGLTAQVNRIIQPQKVLVDIESIPKGLEVEVEYYNVKTPDQIVSWKGHDLNVMAKDQHPYKFKSWSDGNRDRERIVKISKNESMTVQANFCAVNGGNCSESGECCSEHCTSGVCTEKESPTEQPKEWKCEGQGGVCQVGIDCCTGVCTLGSCFTQASGAGAGAGAGTGAEAEAEAEAEAVDVSGNSPRSHTATVIGWVMRGTLTIAFCVAVL